MYYFKNLRYNKLIYLPHSKLYAAGIKQLATGDRGHETHCRLTPGYLEMKKSSAKFIR